MNFTAKIDELAKTRRGFALVLIGSALAAVIFGAFTWSQIDLLIENLRWAQNYSRAISYVIKISVFGVASLVFAACPLAFVVLSLRKMLNRQSKCDDHQRKAE